MKNQRTRKKAGGKIRLKLWKKMRKCNVDGGKSKKHGID